MWQRWVSFIAVLLATLPAVAQEPDLKGWYQVDVIIFKPRNVDLDEESWPESEPQYPADVLSVEPAEFVQLKQLENLGEIADAGSSESGHPSLGQNEFVFSNQGRGAHNRRVIESLTGQNNADNGEPVSDRLPEEGVDPGAIGIDDPSNPLAADPSNEIDPTAMIDIDSIIAALNPVSAGSLAFSDTNETSSLSTVLRSLRRSSRFNVLDAYSWIQPIDGTPTPVMIQTGQRYDDRYEVEGTLFLSRSRFLHVQTQLWYTLFEARGGEANPFVAGFESNLEDDVLKQHPELVEVERERGQYYVTRSHEMTQSRRMRSGEMHYIDHPLFGIIVRINRHTIETAQETTF